ncbi:SGNH/GDSL hydrolase family protein [uncultured Bacteroides sp.]|uniref:SGNH/GDSL hydrolase family protein n=1 Tax=uncultured Bacteroides sp. TaxID=162156 RepID=UPI0026126433|nr:SGNH/GDSL hydrolase family protein [uncultured Bacteroides sp.]
MKTQLKIWLLLSITLIMVSVYALIPGQISLGSFSLVKADYESVCSPPEESLPPILSDSLEQMSQTVADTCRTDTARQRILFLGDSMVEGLCRQMGRYAEENGHKLTSIVWYSSSTQLWAESDTLQHFLKTENPSFVMICLGGNELSVRDLDRRKKHIYTITRKLGDLPYVWIGPPNWKKDTGINKLIEEQVESSRFFDSQHLVLERRKDRMHPTYAAAAQWMDSIAVWMSGSKTRHPIRMNHPAPSTQRKNKLIILAPPNL